MTPEFRAAKQVIRAALREAPRPTVESILDAARAGRVPYMNCDLCLAGRIFGLWTPTERWGRAWFTVSGAYFSIGRIRRPSTDAEKDALRQRILIAICLADLRRRDREAVRTLIESAEPTRRELLAKATWAAPMMTLILAGSLSARMSDWGPYGIPALARPKR